MSPTRPNRRERNRSTLLTSLVLLNLIPTALSYTTNPYFARNANPKPRPVRPGPPVKRDGTVPLKISNYCEQTIWPGIGTQAGTGPGTGGFELDSGDVKELEVGADWQGRIWGRTNCTFNELGTGASNLNGNNGAGAACTTGDCAGVLSCVLTVCISLQWARVALTSSRAKHLSLLLSLILQVALVVIRSSMIFR